VIGRFNHAGAKKERELSGSKADSVY